MDDDESNIDDEEAEEIPTVQVGINAESIPLAN
jgi:hypothetical protein